MKKFWWAIALSMVLATALWSQQNTGGGPGGGGLPCTDNGTTTTCTNPISAPTFSGTASNGGIGGTEGTGANAPSPASGTDVMVWSSATGPAGTAGGPKSGWMMNNGGQGWTNVQGRRRIMMRRTMMWQTRGDTTPTVFGDLGAVVGTASFLAVTSTDPAMIQFASGTVSGNGAGVSGNYNPFITGRNSVYSAYVKMNNADTTSIRFWAGFESQTTAANMNSDGVGDIAAFRYSTVAGDTNFMCVTRDNTTTNAVSSGVAVDNLGHYFDVVDDSANSRYLFYIDGTLKCTLTQNLPRAGILLTWMSEGFTQTTAARNVSIGWVYVESDK